MSFEKEVEVVSGIIQFLQENKYTVTGVFDGEEFMDTDELKDAIETNDTNAMAEFTAAAGSGSVKFKDPKGERFSIIMIYGNSPEEVIADISGQSHEAIDRGIALVNARLEDLVEGSTASPSL